MITQKPWIDKPNTKVWTVLCSDEDPNKQFDCGMWLIWAPWAHPFWQYHWISVVHLREVEGRDKPKIKFEGATHECICFAQNPNVQPRIHPLVNSMLEPLNFAEQFKAQNDAHANEKVEKLVKLVGEGRLSPDSDFRSAWRLLLNQPQ